MRREGARDAAYRRRHEREPVPPSLMPRASPRSRKALERIARAADQGRLSDSDVELLTLIAERFAKD